MYFGMKVHVDADVDSGAVYTIEITSANKTDTNVLPKLLRAEDEVIFGDGGGYTHQWRPLQKPILPFLAHCFCN